MPDRQVATLCVPARFGEVDAASMVTVSPTGLPDPERSGRPYSP
jgi:hypothetical protein